jgi:predicted metalloprotease with PDZ domain
LQRASGVLRNGTLAAALAVAWAVVAPTTGPELEAQEARGSVVRFQERPTGWIGVTFDLELRQSWRSGAPGASPAMVITDIHPDSPAAKAGLQVGDSILRVNQQAVTTEALARLQSTLEPGSRVGFTFRRDGRTRTVSVQAESRPDDDLLVTLPPQVRIRLDSAQAVFLQHVDSAARLRVMVRGDDSRMFLLRAPGDSVTLVSVPPRPGAAFDLSWTEPRAPAPAPFPGVPGSQQARRAGEATVAARQSVETQLAAVRSQMTATERALAELEAHRRPLAPYILGQDWIAGARLTPVNPGLAPYFGVPRGLLVVDIAEGTPAADAGLVAGDVIVSTPGGRGVSTIEELRAVLAQPGASVVPLVLVRQGRMLQVRLAR